MTDMSMAEPPRPIRRAKFGAFVASTAIILAAMSSTIDALGADQPQTEQSRLEIAKLKQEVRKLEIENDHAEGFTADLFRWAPFITVVGGVFTILFAVRKEIRDNRQQRAAETAQRENELRRHIEQSNLDRKQRETELKQQQIEARRRFDELFAQAVGNLGSGNESVQLSAVVVLENSLRAEDDAFQEQVYSVVVANLAIDHSPLVNRFLVRTFETALHRRLASRTDGELTLDFANCRMPRVDLHGLQLNGADFAFATLRDANLVGTTLTTMHGYNIDLGRARLSNATLTGARLHGAQCREAQFHNATLVDVKLRASKERHADLRAVEFYGAKLQGAHLEDADLTDARFDGANLSDAYFTRATLDDDTLRSVLRAKEVKGTSSWRSAHFDAAVQSRLEALAADRGRSRHGKAPTREQMPGPANP